MGADFIFAVCEMPTNVEECRDIINYRIENLNDEIITNIADEYWTLIEDRLTDISDGIDIEESDLWSLGNVDELMVRKLVEQEIKDAVDDLTGYRRDVGGLRLNDTNYIITGGMSWGDNPTDALALISILCTSGVTAGLGKINIDYDSFKC